MPDISGHGDEVAVTDADRAYAHALAESLRRYRKRTGLSQEKLAHAAGIDWKYYQSLENGRGNSSEGSVANPSLQVLRRLAAAYGVDLVDFMFGTFAGMSEIEYDDQAQSD